MSEQRNVESLNPSDFKERGFAFNTYAVKPAMGVTYKDLLVPTYWAHVSPQLKQGDRVEAFAQDASWSADYQVLSSAKSAAKLHLLRFTHFDDSAKEEALNPASYKAEFLTGGDAWRVVRMIDSEVMVRGLQTKAEAEQWIADNIGGETAPAHEKPAKAKK